MESFYTIQGEGYHQGKASYFIRLGGCDVGCHWCDVKDSWDADQFEPVDVKKIAKDAKDSGATIVVVTGGEPLMYDLSYLCDAIHEEGMEAYLETSGAYPYTGSWDWVCFSPKKPKQPLESFYSLADELKVVIYNKDDFKWAEKHAKLVKKDCKLYLQPEWSKREENYGIIVDYIKSTPKWEISLQIHKFLNIP